MSLATDVLGELKKLRERKAFYAAVGAADAAAENLRELPDRLVRLQSRTDFAALSGRAMEYVMVAGARAVQAYEDLAARGMQVVGEPPARRATGAVHAVSAGPAGEPSADGEGPPAPGGDSDAGGTGAG